MSNLYKAVDIVGRSGQGITRKWVKQGDPDVLASRLSLPDTKKGGGDQILPKVKNQQQLHPNSSEFADIKQPNEKGAVSTGFYGFASRSRLRVGAAASAAGGASSRQSRPTPLPPRPANGPSALKQQGPRAASIASSVPTPCPRTCSRSAAAVVPPYIPVVVDDVDIPLLQQPSWPSRHGEQTAWGSSDEETFYQISPSGDESTARMQLSPVGKQAEVPSPSGCRSYATTSRSSSHYSVPVSKTLAQLQMEEDLLVKSLGVLQSAHGDTCNHFWNLEKRVPRGRLNKEEARLLSRGFVTSQMCRFRLCEEFDMAIKRERVAEALRRLELRLQGPYRGAPVIALSANMAGATGLLQVLHEKVAAMKAEDTIMAGISKRMEACVR